MSGPATYYKSEKGFSLIEVSIALIINFFIIIGWFAFQSKAAHTLHQNYRFFEAERELYIWGQNNSSSGGCLKTTNETLGTIYRCCNASSKREACLTIIEGLP